MPAGNGSVEIGAGRSSNNKVVDPVNILLTKSATTIRSIFAWLTVGGKKWYCGVFDRPLIAESIPSGVKISGSTSTSNTVKAIEESLFLEPCPDQCACISATRSIFSWATVGGEGWGESERSTYEHPWMTGLIPSDTNESASGIHRNQFPARWKPGQLRVYPINGVVTSRPYP